MSDNHVDQETSHESHGTKHMILMMLCCMLPIIAIVVVAALFPGASYLNFLFILVCPLAGAYDGSQSVVKEKEF